MISFCKQFYYTVVLPPKMWSEVFKCDRVSNKDQMVYIKENNILPGIILKIYEKFIPGGNYYAIYIQGINSDRYSDILIHYINETKVSYADFMDLLAKLNTDKI